MFGTNHTAENSDPRIYIPHNDGWKAVVKANSIKEYCYYKSPGEDHFHLLVSGEIYLQRGNEKVCLMCAIRHQIATFDRLHWQHRTRTKKKKPMPL